MLSRSVKRSIIPAVLLIVVVAVVLGTRPKVYSFEERIMGTTYHVSYVSDLFSHPVKEVSEKVHAALMDVDQRMSTYKSDSELMRFNRSEVGKPFKVSEDLVQLVTQARKLSVLSGGLYDVTIGPLVNVWGFGPSPDAVNELTEDAIKQPPFLQWVKEQYGKIPAADAIQAAAARVGYESLKADAAHSTLTREKDVFVDLSSIAKGYGVDKAAEALQAQGINDYMVEVGGEVFVHGSKPQGQPWRLGVIGPEMGKNGVSALVEPGNKAMATSGDYLNFFEVDGHRYSHTINPLTGWPEAKRVAEVSVIADTTAEADALATMFMVIGDEKA